MQSKTQAARVGGAHQATACSWHVTVFVKEGKVKILEVKQPPRG